MEQNTNQTEGCAENCPFCQLWAAYRKSDVSEHVRGVQRETLLLARSLLTAAIRATEEGIGTACAGERKV